MLVFSIQIYYRIKKNWSNFYLFIVAFKYIIIKPSYFYIEQPNLPIKSGSMQHSKGKRGGP